MYLSLQQGTPYFALNAFKKVLIKLGRTYHRKGGGRVVVLCFWMEDCLRGNFFLSILKEFRIYLLNTKHDFTDKICR